VILRVSLAYATLLRRAQPVDVDLRAWQLRNQRARRACVV
jgi:hypothetical protein